MNQARQDATQNVLRTIAWIVVIAGSSLGFSLAFACATPFVALAAVAGSQLRARDACCAVLLAWLGNQSIGYLVLGYPRTWDSFAWGAVIGLAALAAAVLARTTAVVPARLGARFSLAFAVSFAAYEGLLFAASFVLPSEGNAFALPIILRIFEVNIVAYLGLLVLHRLAIGVGLLRATVEARPATV